MTDTLSYLPATEAIARFKAKTLSPVELMQAVIARAEAVEPQINAFAFTYYDEAMDLARKAEAKYMRTGARLRPLEGLPVAIKDSGDIIGKPTARGSLALVGNVATRTSPINDRVLKAGGICHARSTTPEFSCTAYCHTRLNGITRNPWNRDFTPGGSSGGAGASLAAGTSSLATGSDIGGSIRIPASCTGTVGYKPPYGRNPGDPPFNLDPYCHSGPMARTVADTILIQNVMAGPHPEDIATIRPKLKLPATYKSVKGMKVAYSVDLGFFEVDPAVRANLMQSLEVFRDLGAEVTEIDIPWTHEVLDSAVAYLLHIFGRSMLPLVATHANELTDYARHFAELSQESTADDLLKAMNVAAETYKSFASATKGFDLFVCPTTALPAVPADFNQSTDKCLINDKPVHPALGWVMTTPFNMLSRCPVLSVPSGHAPNRVPTGIQLVGQTYRDVDVFRAASAFEDAVGGWYGSAQSRPSL